MEIKYGCESPLHGVIFNRASNAPVAYIVLVDGRRIELCTKCATPGLTLWGLYYDETTNLAPFVKYDPEGAMALLSMLRILQGSIHQQEDTTLELEYVRNGEFIVDRILMSV